MATWTQALPYFPVTELRCKGTHQLALDLRFAAELVALRVDYGRPMFMNSVCRSPSHNSKVGGHPRSLHLTENPVHPTDGCMAGDVRWYDWPEEDKLEFARLAWRRGWSIGLNDAFCHIDRRSDFGLAQVIFDYAGGWHGELTPADIRGAS